MYFTDDPTSRRWEREMKGVPNFGRREVWEKCESCESCINFDRGVFVKKKVHRRGSKKYIGRSAPHYV